MKLGHLQNLQRVARKFMNVLAKSMPLHLGPVQVQLLLTGLGCRTDERVPSTTPSIFVVLIKRIDLEYCQHLVRRRWSGNFGGR